MAFELDDLQAMRECCRDDAAFERLQTLLANLPLLPDIQRLNWQTSDWYRLRYEAILNALPDRVFLVNRNGDNLDFKGTPEDIANGVDRDAVIGTNLRQFVPPDVAESCLRAIAQTLDSRTLQTLEYQIPKAWAPNLGDVRDYELRLVVSGENEVLVIERDITDRKQREAEHRQTEERLLQAESQYRSIFEAVSDGLIISDAETGAVVEANPACYEMHGYTYEEFLGLTPATFIHPDSYPLFEDYVASVKAGRPFRCRAVDLRKDGTLLNIEVIGNRFNYQGKPHLLGVIRDISDQVRAETALRASEARNRALVEAIPDSMFRIAADGTCLDAKVAKDNDLIVPPEQLIGQNLKAVLPEAVGQQWLQKVQQALQTGDIQSFDYQILINHQVRDREARLGASGAHEVVAIMRDITERKQAEAALQQSEARNRAFLNALPDLMFRISRDGTYLDFKADKETDFAIPPEQMVGKSVYEVLPFDVAQQRMEYVKRTLETGEIQVYEYQLSKQGDQRDYEARIVASGEHEVLAIMRDITDRKRAVAQLQVNADRDRLLGQIALRIRRSLNLDQILATTVEEVQEFLHADRVFIGQIDANLQGRIIAESAAPEWGSILTWIVDDLYLREIRELFAQGQIQVLDNTEQANLSPLLAEYYQNCHIQASLGVPIILNDDFFGVLVVNQCAHPRHWLPLEVELLSQLATQVAIAIQQAELYQQVQTFAASLERQVQERTAQLQQNMQELQTLSQVKDDFLHAVSHDLRTPVIGLSMVLKNLQNKPGDTITLSRSVLDRMVHSCDRQLAMINSLLEAHSNELDGITIHSESVNIGQLVHGIVEDLEPWAIANQGELTSLVAFDLPLILADAALLRRVFENLLTNALKHNPPGLHITIAATIADDMLHCSVQDDGVGLTQSECDHLFDRYARGTRARRSTGLGLGLYLCKQIITAHGGQIGAISTPGAGATFWFTLPLLTE